MTSNFILIFIVLIVCVILLGIVPFVIRKKNRDMTNMELFADDGRED